MKLSPALIYRELNQVYTTTAGGALSTKPTLKRPMLLGMDVKPNPGALCILAPDHVRAASAHPSALLVTVGKGSASPGQWVVDAPSLEMCTIKFKIYLIDMRLGIRNWWNHACKGSPSRRFWSCPTHFSAAAGGHRHGLFGHCVGAG